MTRPVVALLVTMTHMKYIDIGEERLGRKVNDKISDTIRRPVQNTGPFVGGVLYHEIEETLCF